MVQENEGRLTVQRALQSIGAWVRVVPGERRAIVIKVTGTGVLVRLAGDTGRRGVDSHYLTCGLVGLRLLEGYQGPDPNWLRRAIETQCKGTPDLAGVVAVRNGQPQEPVSPEFVFAAYARERALDNPVADLFDDVEALEARYQEQLQLDAELHARVLRDVHSPATGEPHTLGNRP